MPDEILNLLANTYSREYRKRIARCGVLASACVSGVALFAVLRFWYPWWGITLGAAVAAGVIWFALKHGIPALPPTRPEIAAIIDHELESKDRMGALVELEASPTLADTPQRHLIARQLAALIPQLRQLDPTRFDRLAPLRLSRHDSHTLGASALLLLGIVLLVWLRPLSEFEQLAETLTQIVQAHPELPAPVQARTRELVETLSATTQDPAAIAAALKRAQEELSQPLAGGNGAADSESLTLQAPDTDSTTQGSSPSQGGGASPQQAKPNKAPQPRPEQPRTEQQQAQQQAPPQPPQQRDPQHRPERAQRGESTQQQPQQGQGQQSQPQQGTQGASPQDTQQQPAQQPQSAGGQGKESQQEQQEQQGGAGQSESSSQGQQGGEKKDGEKQDGAGGQKKGDQQGQQGQGDQGSNQGGAGGQGAGQNPDSQGNADGNNGAAGNSGAQAGQQQGKADQAGKDPGSSAAQGGQQGSNAAGQQGSGSADQQGAQNAGTDSQTNPAQSAPEQLNQAFSKVQQSLEKKGQSGSGQGSSEQRQGSQGSSDQSGAQPPSGSNPLQNPSQGPQGSSGDSKDTPRDGHDGSQGSSPNSPSGAQQPPSAGNNQAGADPAAGDQGREPPPPGSNDQRAERGGSRDGSGERSSLPDRNAATRTDDPNGTQPGGESGLGGRQGFKESRIQGEGEQFDTRFTGGAAQRERNSAPAQARTSIEDVLIAKPKGSRDRGAQPIPLEYKDIFRE